MSRPPPSAPRRARTGGQAGEPEGGGRRTGCRRRRWSWRRWHDRAGASRACEDRWAVTQPHRSRLRRWRGPPVEAERGRIGRTSGAAHGPLGTGACAVVTPIQANETMPRQSRRSPCRRPWMARVLCSSASMSADLGAGTQASPWSRRRSVPRERPITNGARSRADRGPACSGGRRIGPLGSGRWWSSGSALAAVVRSSAWPWEIRRSPRLRRGAGRAWP